MLESHSKAGIKLVIQAPTGGNARLKVEWSDEAGERSSLELAGHEQIAHFFGYMAQAQEELMAIRYDLIRSS